MPTDARTPNLIRRLHRANAILLGLFLLLHFANHVAALLGIDAHLSIQAVLRHAYRLPGVEHVLIGLFLSQVALGLILLVRRGKPEGVWGWAQAISGGYLVLFIAQHLGAILAARFVPPGLDTNSYFAAAVVSRSPFVWYFAPYYLLGVAAVFTHVACAFRFRDWPAEAKVWQKGLPFLGLLVGLISVVGLMGVTETFEMPPEYEAYLDRLLPEALPKTP